MNILLVSATELEIKPFLAKLESVTLLSPFLRQGNYVNHQISVLFTGIGMTNTALHLSPLLARHRFDIAIQAGIAGSYTRQWDIGNVVEVIQENYADLGAEDSDGSLLDLQKLGFASFTDSYQKRYFNTFQNPECSQFSVSKVISNTVNLCSGTEVTIQKRLHHFPAEIENMEGAAFFQTCLLYHQRFCAFRAISNYVEVRDKTCWNIPLAVRKLSEFLEVFLTQCTFSIPAE